MDFPIYMGNYTLLRINSVILLLMCFRDYDIEECKNTVHEAIRKGVNFIDTAPWYGHGESEKILGLVSI